jgi:hypothetical protein
MSFLVGILWFFCSVKPPSISMYHLVLFRECEQMSEISIDCKTKLMLWIINKINGLRNPLGWFMFKNKTKLVAFLLDQGPPSTTFSLLPWGSLAHHCLGDLGLKTGSGAIV